MSRPTPSRKARLRAALALAGMSVDQLCAEMEISRNHLYTVLRGDRESARLVRDVDAFISRHLPRQAAA